jgi:putative ABC transport system permease protein
MRPPTPPSYKRLWGAAHLARYFSQLTVMVVRYVMRWPLRTATSIAGISFAVALLVSSMFATDSIDWMIDTTFHRTDRQDATLQFGSKRPERAVESVAKLPGVLRVEPFRTSQVVIRHGQFSKRASIVGKPDVMDLSRVLDLSLNPVTLPKSGLVLGDALAEILHVRQGDMVEVAFVEKGRRTVQLPVSEVIQSYLGLVAYMDIEALNDSLGDGRLVSGANVSFDSGERKALFDAIQETPAVMGIALQGISLQKFRETIARNIAMTSSVYISLAIVIAFGVAYNSARIQFSERARELASLRVLGFTNAEVSRVLLSEFAFFAIVAIPIGWALGYSLAYAVVAGFDSELYRIPFIISSATTPNQA